MTSVMAKIIWWNKKNGQNKHES